MDSTVVLAFKNSNRFGPAREWLFLAFGILIRRVSRSPVDHKASDHRGGCLRLLRMLPFFLEISHDAAETAPIAPLNCTTDISFSKLNSSC